MICKVLDECGKVPYFNASIYLENIKKIGKVDEVFGRVDNVMFTVKPDPGVGLSGWEKGDKVFALVNTCQIVYCHCFVTFFSYRANLSYIGY